MLSPDTILQNRYRITRHLGQGGMGTVYEAVDQRVNAVVALKETIVAGDDRWRRELETEAGLLANLQHQALPKVMDYFFEGESEYLVMEHIPGYDLLELLKRRGAPFHLSLVLRWADAILSVLEYLHRHKPPILHRDIKPSNLKLTQQEELFLLDFGIAKGSAGQMPTMLTDRSVRGYTPVYSPLEQIIGQGTDPRSDLYSLGATIYHLLSGVRPSDAASRYELLESGKPDPLLPIHQANPQVPVIVAEVIHRAMAVGRKDRYETATLMRRALSQAGEEARLAREQLTSRKRQQLDEESKRAQEVESWRVAEPEATKERVRSQRLPPSPVVPAPSPRKSRGVLLGAILAAAAIVLAVALIWRFNTGDGGRANPDLQPTPQPSASAEKQKSFTQNINGVTLEMVLVPGGTFAMGSPDNEGYLGEHPQHQVTVPAFYMGKFEMTQAQWRALMGTNPSKFQGDKLPVESVSWDDAVAFCRRLSTSTGREYRLPSEAQWEYACRAGTTTKFSFGNSLTSGQANFDYRSPYSSTLQENSRQQTTPVGSFPPNQFGLYDMHGNVFEWCLDPYYRNYNGAPTDGSDWKGASGSRVMRGGSWSSVADGLRSAARDRTGRDSPSPGIGFRVVTAADK